MPYRSKKIVLGIVRKEIVLISVNINSAKQNCAGFD